MRVTINGKKIFIDVEGEKLCHAGAELVEKPTLLLLHGSPGNSDHTVFKPMFSVLADVAQIVYVDLAGSGRSDDPVDFAFSLESWADDVAELCSVLEIERPIVLGNSAGGMVAAVYGIRHSEQAGKIILSSTHARLIADRCLKMFQQLGGDEVREVARQALVEKGDFDSFMEYARICMPLYNPTPLIRVRHSIFRRKCAEVFHNLGGIWHVGYSLESLREITCPTLVIAGQDDPVTPIEDSHDIVAHLNPEIVQFESFPNAGHGVWLDNPERAFSVLREFITQK